jgi:hypothetical protein
VSHPDSVSRYNPGAMARLVATIVSTDGVTPADASVIDIFVKDSQGTVTTYRFPGGSVIRVGTGAYAHDHQIPYSANAVGSWFYGYLATGGAQAAEEWSFIVERSFIL